MSLRPMPARWFELLTVPDDLARALEALARTGAIELETRLEPSAHANLPALHDQLLHYRALAQRYQAHWPQSGLQASRSPGSPARQFDAALTRLVAWAAEAESVVHRSEVLQAELSHLHLLAEMLAALDDTAMDFALIANAGPALLSRLLVLPPQTLLDNIPADVLRLRVTTPLHTFLLAVAPPAELQTLERELTALKGRGIPLPAWLSGNAGAAAALVTQRTAEADDALQQRRAEIDALNRTHELHAALGDIHRLEWLLVHVAQLPVSDNFVWVTGWTSDADGAQLQDALDHAAVRGVLDFPRAPNVRAPMVLRNWRWVRPFELFVGLLGIPSHTEADPSVLLALVVPLLFGYMFGDVGQGLVLLIIGLYLQRRMPAMRLLVSGGAAAILFGFVFGSVFSREDLLTPLWVNPIEHPLPVIMVPLVAGALLLLIGVLLNAIESVWSGEGRAWLLTEAPLPLLYLAAAAALFDRRALYVMPLGLIWQFLGSAWEGRQQALLSGLAGLGGLVEHLLQLIINSLSFARVGAFALAHAGLSLAFAGLAHAAGAGIAAVLIMVLGNLLVIALEGLVVSIQTTRLVLFEFFVRFLRAEGRVFQPLTAP